MAYSVSLSLTPPLSLSLSLSLSSFWYICVYMCFGPAILAQKGKYTFGNTHWNICKWLAGRVGWSCTQKFWMKLIILNKKPLEKNIYIKSAMPRLHRDIRCMHGAYKYVQFSGPYTLSSDPMKTASHSLRWQRNDSYIMFMFVCEIQSHFTLKPKNLIVDLLQIRSRNTGSNYWN